MNGPDHRPLVLLDIDGVLHDSAARDRIRLSDEPQKVADALAVSVIVVHGHTLAIPAHMPALVKHLADIAEVWWYTTWRHRANGQITEQLGITTLPVIDDGTRTVGLEWKVTAARPLIEKALSKGRDVFWIEDFKGTLPEIDGVEYIDTTGAGSLITEDLPDTLRPGHSTS